jgi:hypothetical protein
MFGFNIPWMAYAIAGMLAILAGTNAYTYFKATAAAEGAVGLPSSLHALAVAQADIAALRSLHSASRDAGRALTQSDTEMRQRLDEYARTINGNAWLRY